MTYYSPGDMIGEDGWSQIELQLSKNPDEQVKPFKKKNVEGAKEYTCFDLSKMTQDIKIMNSQWKAAQQLVEKNKVALQSVAEGYVNDYYRREKILKK